MHERRQLVECFLCTVKNTNHTITGVQASFLKKTLANSFFEANERTHFACKQQRCQLSLRLENLSRFFKDAYLNGFSKDPNFGILDDFFDPTRKIELFRPLPVLLSPRDRFFRDRREKLSRSSWSFCELGPNPTFFPG